MSWVLITIAGWLTAIAVVGLFAWALARSPAIGDHEEAEQLETRDLAARLAAERPDRKVLAGELADAAEAIVDPHPTAPEQGVPTVYVRTSLLGALSRALYRYRYAHTRETDEPALDRRVGPEDRRSGARPWAERTPGRRAEDALREDLAEAHQLLRDAEARLAEIEARRSA